MSTNRANAKKAIVAVGDLHRHRHPRWHAARLRSRRSLGDRDADHAPEAGARGDTHRPATTSNRTRSPWAAVYVPALVSGDDAARAQTRVKGRRGPT